MSTNGACAPVVSAENWLRIEDQYGRAPLTPDFGEPDPEEAISWAQLRSRMAALINLFLP
jgi:hypothetical protein